jgi:hypothetical protein
VGCKCLFFILFKFISILQETKDGYDDESGHERKNEHEVKNVNDFVHEAMK